MTTSKSSSRRLTILHRPSPIRSSSTSLVPEIAVEKRTGSPPPRAAPRLRPQKSASLLRLGRPLSTFFTSFNNYHTDETSPKRDQDLQNSIPRKEVPIHPATAPPQIPNTLRKSSPQPVSSTPDLLKPLPPVRSPIPSPQSSPALRGRSRHGSLAPPPTFSDLGVAGTSGSRPSTSDGEVQERETNRLSKARSWLPGRSRHTSKDLGRPPSPRAWINAGENKIDYNHNLLIESEMVPELWDETGDTYVYLYPRNCKKAPVFKIHSLILASSPPLVALTHGDVFSTRPRSRTYESRGKPLVVSENDMRKMSLPMRPSTPSTPPYTPSLPAEAQSISDGSMDDSLAFSDSAPKENHLYFPINLSADGIMGNLSDEDVESLIQVRNLFAFLTGQPLIATELHPSVFTIFLSISSMLKRFEFSNYDGSTFGESAATSFAFFKDEFGLQDVSKSLGKTIEALVLGERMRCIELYNEAFAHAVGKYDSLLGIKSPYYDFISANTRKRMELAAMDLQQRKLGASERLTDFEFPSMFTGTAASTSSEESKIVSFKDWKANFMSFRKHVLSYYKHQFGSWPPKASSKKNDFEEGGLNRLVLKQLYHDFSQLYDFLVDRKSETTRTMDHDVSAVDVDPVLAIIRRVLGEFDRSSPPVAPPIPFDVPLVPSVATIDPGIETKSPKEVQKASKKNLKDYQTTLVLTKACNLDADIHTHFLSSYKEYEAKESRHKNVQELASHRIGVWLFLYAVMQSLPMLVVDAPGLKYTHNIEYFLCEVSKGTPPWVEDAQGGGGVKMAWYGVSGGAGVVALPSDIVEYGVEGVYRRSHCWEAAKSWALTEEIYAPPPLDPPSLPGFGFEDRPSSAGSGTHSQDSRGRSRDSRHDSLTVDMTNRSLSRGRLSSVALGLEQLPVPAGFNSGDFVPRTASPLGGTRARSHSRNASMADGYGSVYSGGSAYGGASGSGHGSGTGTPVPAPAPPVSKGPSTFDAILGDLSGGESTPGSGNEGGGKASRKSRMLFK